MMSNKLTRNWKIQRPEITDIPDVFLLSHQEILKQDRGQYKLRARNDQIHAELLDYATRCNSRILTNKVGSRIFYAMKDGGVVVSLAN